MNEKISQIVSKGIDYLCAVQQEDGCFLSYSSVHSDTFHKKYTYQTTFATSLILPALTQIPSPALTTMRKKAIQFLLAQKSPHWSWNYWARTSEQAKTMVYPDDLDDTFCALTALLQYDNTCITGAVMAHIVQMLTATEIQEGGPYRTWLVKEDIKKKWQDIDIAVNANIAYFLSLHDIELEKLTIFIDSHIEKKDFISPYYPSVYPIIYYLSRFYKGKLVSNMQDFLIANMDKETMWGNPLHTALALSSLLNFGVDLEVIVPSVTYLLGQQQKGVWKAYGFCFDPTRKGKKYIAGSPALTTAFCLEALTLYTNKNVMSYSTVEKKQDKREEQLYRDIMQQVEKRFSLFDISFQQQAFSVLNELMKKDTLKQIPLLPYFFSLSLGENGKDIEQDLLIQLGAANIFGWIAYTIYDNFLDEEGNPPMLSSANVALRELVSLFDKLLPENTEFRKFFQRILDQIDATNTWEVLNCRIPVTNGKITSQGVVIPDYGNYEKLAQKSLGHALGPAGIFFALGYTQESTEIQHTLSFFTHYLIARQLHDDVHDWEKDLRMGQINPVAALLLTKIPKTQTIQSESILLKTLIPKMQKLLWYEVIEEVCTIIFDHIGKARLALKENKIIVDHTYFEQILSRYETAAEKTLQERKRAIQFLENY